MEAASLTINLEGIGFRFRQASSQTKLVMLHYLIRQLNQASSMTKPSALFSQKVQAVVKSIQRLPREERYEALQEILTCVPTRITEAYEELDTNMRMAFWYRLMSNLRGDAYLSHSLNSDAKNLQTPLLSDLASCDSNELVSLLREMVSDKVAVPSYR